MITVLMPYFNASSVSERIWRTCIESILNQTYRLFIIVAIDDGSTDNSRNVLHSYKDSRIVSMQNKQHIGLTKSLNIAFDNASGNYIARHDSDDFSDKERFAKQVDFFEHNADISVLGSHASVYDVSLKKYDVQKKKLSHDAIYNEAKRANPMLHGSVIMRTQALRGVSGYDESFVVCQDYDLWCRMLRKGYRFANLDEYLYNRVSHPNCATKVNRAFRKTALDRIRKSWS